MKILFIALILMISSNLFSQSDKKDKNQQTKTFDTISNIRNNNKYVVRKINDQYDFYSETSSKSKNIGIADNTGNVILPNIFNFASNSKSNKYEVLLRIDDNVGLFNLNELSWGIPMEYGGLDDLGNNLYIAKKNLNWGVIDNNNVTIVPFEWHQISNIYIENYITVTNANELKGIYSLVERKLLIPCLYKSIDRLDNPNNFLVKNNTKYNIIDVNNVPKFKKWYDEIVSPNSRNYFIVKENNRFGVIDDSEKEIVPIEYLEFHFTFLEKSYLARNKDGKYGLIQIDGKITLPFEYDKLDKNTSSNRNILTFQNGKYGLVQLSNGTPNVILACNYDDIKGGNMAFIVEKGGKFGLLNFYGKLITEVEYESIDDISDEGIIFKAKRNNYYSLMNEQGKLIGRDTFIDISAIIKNSDSYSYNSKFAYLKAHVISGKYCIIDRVGKTVTKPIFDDITSQNGNIFIVKSNGKYGLYSLLDQKPIVDYTYDLIIKTDDNYFGISGKKIDFLINQSGKIAVIKTTK